MRKAIFTLALTASCMLSCAQETINLPAPSNGSEYDMSLMQALQQRRSERSYADTELSSQQLSTILWAACGISDEKTGKITAPSAMNKQDITIYVCRKDGAWQYDNKSNSLTKVSGKDLRGAVASRQAFAATAPVSIVIVSDQSKYGAKALEFGAMSAGYVSQNIYLACTAMGLYTVARATMDVDVLRQELGLKDTDLPLLNHPIAFPNK
ncbi:MAG: SagB/ThcOx family dehydrogenase [Prevotella sp.]|nr:SagB/ThcOx family dehydrogenase [Prevotella sp.]